MLLRSSRWVPLALSFFAFAGCSSGSEEGADGPGDGDNTSVGTGGMSSGSGGSGLATGGALASGGALGTTGGVSGVGGDGAGTGGTDVGTGGSNLGTGGESVVLPPVDCSAIASSWELCGSTDDTCTAVFDDSTGCSEVCEAAGLVCAEVWENADGECAPDTGLAELSCDPPSGHQSDYCVCARDPNAAGSGGAMNTGGEPGSGGAMSTGGATSTGGAMNTGGSMGTGGSTNTGGGGNSGNAPCDVPDFIFSQPTADGWASQNGGTTGGGNATPVLVTTLAQLQSEVSGTTAKVIYVEGDLSPGKIPFGSNKTIIGCSSGAHIRGALQIGSGDSNIIIRNINVSGYAVGNCALDPDFDSGEGCSSGNDAIGVNGNAHHVWFDHISVQDGSDGNLDVTNDADYVTISWSKFSYTARTDNTGNDSTGAAGHRFSNLVGGSDTNPTGFPGTRPLNVTWHHNWWGANVVERMPRIRFGRNHLYNNYFDSNTANYCVRAGKEARVLLQANYFDGVKDAHEFNSDTDEGTAYISVGSSNLANVYNGTSGEQATGGGGEQWNTPPYAFSADPAANVPSLVTDGAGPQ
jgi:pectate lyase